jgi:hypothetical protein
MGSSIDCKNSPNVRQQTFQKITTPKTCSPWVDHVGGSSTPTCALGLGAAPGLLEHLDFDLVVEESGRTQQQIASD